MASELTVPDGYRIVAARVWTDGKTVLVEGENRVRIYQTDGAELPPGFVPVPATLEDAYFLLVRSENSATAGREQ